MSESMPRTITTVEALEALSEGAVVMGFERWDREQLVSVKQQGEWKLAGSDDWYQHAGLDDVCDELVVLWEPQMEAGA